ncbi:CPCC family cysteine-rich protein [Corallococcus exiguus]
MHCERGANEEAIQVLCRGVTNGFLSPVCEAILGGRVEVVGEAEVLLPWPCCGHRTLTELYDSVVRTGYDICNHCRWEDDGIVSDSVHGSVNKAAMSQYRERIREESNYFYREKWS